ncbi:SDR family NAD(P)-dependent oxidoreductase [Nocardioides pelophilus]|uniref:SDR family NAD(P)-dependent oxidoreductase n=1 Tax=Nocardioides pelophilus TaxID=2172019 RepID=UPI0015FFA485|nr:SDR family NAD(P)-dependent oxidoreductase [Nocardioides pelophilus]
MTADRGLDRLLDRGVLPGYSAVGYRLRRRGWDPDDPRPGALVGRRALVTGAGGGLGEATALGLARLGATVHLVVRSEDRAAGAVERITETLRSEGRSAALEVEVCDVSDLGAVAGFARALADRLATTNDALDVVVHNAGVLPVERTTSVDGHELTVATHVLGPVLMTELLLPVLREAPGGARVVLVASGGMYAQPLPADDPEFTAGPYRGTVAYARSKRMQVELAPVLARRWAPEGVSVFAMHPGWADTPGVASSLPLFRALTRPVLRSPEAGADTAVWLAATRTVPRSGTFWHDRSSRPTSYRFGPEPTASEVESLWRWVLRALDLEGPGRHR